MSEQETHTDEQKPVNIWPMFAGGLVLIVLFVGMVIWLRTSTERGESEDSLRSAQRLEFLNQAKLEAAVLQGYSWANKETGTVRIPIDSAMEKTIANLAGAEPKAAYPITQSPPSPPVDAKGVPEAIRKLSPAAQAAAAGEADAATDEPSEPAASPAPTAEPTPEGGAE